MKFVAFASLVLLASSSSCASGCYSESLQPPCRPITTEPREDFSKPECSRELEDRFMSPSQAPPPAEQGTQSSRKLYAREFMVAKPGAKQSWIFEGEPFVVDGRIWLTSAGAPEQLDYDVVVLKDYTEIVPVFFDVVESKDAYVHEDEIAALPDEALAKHHVAPIQNHIPLTSRSESLHHSFQSVAHTNCKSSFSDTIPALPLRATSTVFSSHSSLRCLSTAKSQGQIGQIYPLENTPSRASTRRKPRW